MLRKIKKQLSIAIASVFLALSFGGGMALAQFNENPQHGLCEGATLNFNPDTQKSCGDFQHDNNINKIIELVINLFSLIVGIVAVIMIIWGGFKYITSAGDTTKITSARNSILYAIIGLIIVALAQFIVQFVLEKSAGTTAG